MFIDQHNYFDNKTMSRATRAIIYDNMGQPIALFIDNSDETITCYTASDQNFSEVLTQFGIEPPNIKRISIGG